VAAENGVRGVVKNVTIDFRPPSLRRLVMASRVKDAREALVALGLGVDEDGSPKSGGLLVSSVQGDKPAGQAGIQKGDLVLGFNGVSVTSLTDLIPPAGTRVASVSVRRGETEALVFEVSTKDIKPGTIPTDALAAILLLVVAIVVLVIFMAPVAGIITWFERRVAGRMQSRIGPNRAGPHGFLIWLADGLKSFMTSPCSASPPTSCSRAFPPPSW
jgi:NADH-quinone oxidoreductase subunit H